MRRIYLFILIASLALNGFLLWPTEGVDSNRINEIQSLRDSLNRELLASDRRYLSLKDSIDREQLAMAAYKDSLDASTKKYIDTKTQYYENKINKIRTYTIPQLDSVFTALYPRPTEGSVSPRVEGEDDHGGPSAVGVSGFNILSKEHSGQEVRQLASKERFHDDETQDRIRFRAGDIEIYMVEERGWLPGGKFNPPW